MPTAAAGAAAADAADAAADAGGDAAGGGRCSRARHQQTQQLSLAAAHIDLASACRAAAASRGRVVLGHLLSMQQATQSPGGHTQGRRLVFCLLSDVCTLLCVCVCIFVPGLCVTLCLSRRSAQAMHQQCGEQQGVCCVSAGGEQQGSTHSQGACYNRAQHSQYPSVCVSLSVSVCLCLSVACCREPAS